MRSGIVTGAVFETTWHVIVGGVFLPFSSREGFLDNTSDQLEERTGRQIK